VPSLDLQCRFTMHRALLLEEIIEVVVAQLDHERSSLGALACTNRVFSRHALDILWRSPPLWQLAERMDSGVRTYEEDIHAENSTLVTTRILVRLALPIF
jgi:hypothetical protein